MKRIVLIEDDRTIAGLIAQILTESGYEVDTVHNVGGGARYVETADPDLILLDLGMPNPGGVALLKWCKADATRARVPVIVIAGPSRMIPRDAPPPEAVLQKPFNIDDLCNTVERCLAGAPALVSEVVA